MYLNSVVIDHDAQGLSSLAIVYSIWSLIYETIISARNEDLQTVSRSAQGFLVIPLSSLVKDRRIQELWRLHTWASLKKCVSMRTNRTDRVGYCWDLEQTALQSRHPC
ncbi:hypothetical protein ACQKWADRAFT_213553 [Trichoderma austrokoningii]